MRFPLERFYEFCSNLTISTKEMGQVPLRLLGTQRYFIEEVAKGLEEDQHLFVVLKGRQLGISTVSLGLDLFWLARYGGLGGSLVTDTEGNRNFFRSILEDYLSTLPLRFRIRVRTHNRSMLWLANKSKLHYMTAGTRRSGAGTLGRGKGINFLHATECSSYGDQEGVESLIATLAEQAPNRLYVFESTARGFNVFYDMWEDAKRALTQRAIFIGWWRNEFYRVPRDSRVFNVYWDGRLTGEEREWVQQIKALYGIDIEPEQIAWWRWKSEEVMKSGQMMLQEFPPTEEYAFQVTGFRFFSGARLTESWKQAEERTPKFYRYEYGSTFDTIQLIETNEANSTLKVWEPYIPGATYVLGADPAYGSSEYKDNFSIQVLRCYADKVVQVAEYCTTEGYMYSFAWIIAHLAGYYKETTVLIEINGPGAGVLQEFRRLAETASGIRSEHGGEIQKALAGIAHYLYRRVDSLSGHFALQWKSTAELKERVFNQLRDTYDRGMLEISSLNLLDEMRYITKDGSHIAASGTRKDDSTVAMALAVHCWASQVQPTLESFGRYSDSPPAPLPDPDADTVLDRTISNYLDGIFRP